MMLGIIKHLLKVVCIVTISLSFSFKISADVYIDSLGIYAHGIKQDCIYVYGDNLIRRKVNNIFTISPLTFYYLFKNTPQLELYSIESKIDRPIKNTHNTKNNTGHIYIRTQNAGTGFLEINDSITSFIKAQNIDINSTQIKYIYNGELFFNEDAYCIAQLEKEDIQKFALNYDAYSKIITANIESKNYQYSNDNDSIKLRKVKLAEIIRNKIDKIIKEEQIDKTKELLEITFDIDFHDEVEFIITKKYKNKINYSDKYFIGYELIDDYFIIVRILRQNNVLFDYITYDSDLPVKMKVSKCFTPLISPNLFYHFMVIDNVVM